MTEETKPAGFQQASKLRSNAPISVSLRLKSLDTIQGSVAADMYGGFFGSSLDNIYDCNRKQYVEDKVGDFQYAMKPEYNDIIVPISVIGMDGTHIISLPFSYLNARTYEQDVNSTQQVAFRLDRKSNRYPDDWYLFSVSASIPPSFQFTMEPQRTNEGHECSGIETLATSHKIGDDPVSDTPILAPPITIYINNNVSNADMNVSSEYGLTLGKGGFTTLAHAYVLLDRPKEIKEYSYVIASIPLILAFLFFHFLFVHELRKDRPTIDLLIGLAAFVLTVLPIRLVLVPSDVQGLTEVDYLLSAGVTLMITMALFGYGIDLWKHKEAK